FGDQFAYSARGGEVVRFEAELGRIAPVAPSLLDWIEALWGDPGGVLPIDLVAREATQGKRLAPGIHLFAYPPLFSVEAREGVSVGQVDAVEAMRFRGQLARQIKDLPAGTQVKIELD